MKKRNNIKTEIEYEEAPYGYVTFYNYKEPLMKFTEGYGFVGALVFDGKTDKIQCHLCGEWLGYLPHHLAREHNMKSSAYKDKVGLLQTTALISESARAKLIASGLDKRLQNLRAGGKKTQAQKNKIKNTLIKNGEKEENRNLKGTCPEQIIYRMQQIAKEKGENLRMRDFDNFDEIIKKLFGSIKNACEIANITYHPPCLNYKTRRKYTKEQTVNFIREFVLRFNRLPRYTDYYKQSKGGLYNAIMNNKKNKKEITVEALAGMDAYTHIAERITYTDEQLLNFLRKFEKINGRKPAISDAKRNLIPNASNYYHHFGNWKQALKKAFNQ